MPPSKNWLSVWTQFIACILPNVQGISELSLVAKFSFFPFAILLPDSWLSNCINNSLI